MARKRTARKSSELNFKAVQALTDVHRTDELIKEVCKKYKVQEKMIRAIGGWQKR